MTGPRVAALYDVHGNLPALEAVLVEVERQRVDLVVVGGDVAWGPMPAETLDRLRAFGDRARFLRGNADREVAGRVIGIDPEIDAVTLWCADRLGPEQLAFLAALPERVSLDIVGLGPALFCHGSPRRDDERITATTPEARLAEMLAGVLEETVVFGHTHAQFERVACGKRLVNPGSAGLPYGERGAYWALLGPGVQLRRTEYDVERAAQLMRAAGTPADFAGRILEPPPWEAALEVMDE